MMTRNQQRRLSALCLAFWFIFLWLILPAVSPMFPAFWWYDVRTVKVENETAIVTIDRDIHAYWWDRRLKDDGRRYWIGKVNITIRRVSGEDEVPSTCGPSGRSDIRFVDGAPFPPAERDLNWFMDSPPNAGCDLQPGDYVAHFEWTRKFFGLPLRARASSNIFRIS